jgi:hypothetical protein
MKFWTDKELGEMVDAVYRTLDAIEAEKGAQRRTGRQAKVGEMKNFPARGARLPRGMCDCPHPHAPSIKRV